MNRAGGSPCPGGSFFAEPQRRVALCGTRETAAPAAGAKRKGHLRFPFLFELLPFPCFLIWRRFPICDRFEIGERQLGYRCVCFAKYSQFKDSVLLHRPENLRWARHSSAAQLFNTLYRTAPANLAFGTIYPRRPCLSQCAYGLRDTGMSRLRRVNRLCSSTVSDTANRLLKRTDSEGSSSAAEKKSSAVPRISQRSHVGNLRQTLKGKGRFTRGWKPQVSTLLCARAASAQFRSLLKRHSHVRERGENQRVETAGVYPLARRRGCGEPPRQRLAPILYAQEAAKPQFTSCTDRNRVLK